MALYNELRRPIAEDKEFNKHYSLTSRLVRLKTNLCYRDQIELDTRVDFEVLASINCDMTR